MTRPKAYINPKMLKWARERIGYSIEDFEKISPHYRTWEDESTGKQGDNRPYPTMRQAEAFAKKTHIPFGYLYLDNPPELKLATPDFRMGLDKNPNKEQEIALYDHMSSYMYKKEWYDDYLKTQQINISSHVFQGKFSSNSNPSAITIAQDIRKRLKLDTITSKTSKPFYEQFIKNAEEANIWIIRTGIVKGNTQRSISPQTCRGFALKSDFYPMIWVNSNTDMSDAARNFTLSHELAHIWIGEEGISNYDGERDADKNIESLCDKVAANLLVPEEEIRKEWNPNKSISENIDNFRNTFPVSQFVTLRRTRALDMIDEREYKECYTVLYESYRKHMKQKETDKKKAKKDGKPSGGGDYYNTKIAAYGRKFCQAVISETFEENITIKDAFHLLDISKFSTLEGLNKTLVGDKS